MSVKIKKNPEFLEKSIILDSEIYYKLGGILLNTKINYNLKNQKNENFPKNQKNLKIFENEQNFETSDNFEENNFLLKKKLKEIIKFFNVVNNERIYLREILVELIKKKFWKILNEKKNEDFFINKIKGINLEILKKSIEKLNFEKKKNLDLIEKKKKMIFKLKENNENLENELKKAKENFKKILLTKNKNLNFEEKNENFGKLKKRNFSKNLKNFENFEKILKKKSSSKRVIKRRKNTKRSIFGNSQFFESHKNIGKDIDLDLDNINDLYNSKYKKLNKRASMHF